MYSPLLIAVLQILFSTTYIIIPKFAPDDQQDMIQSWTGLAFNGVLLSVVVFQTRFQDPSLITPIIFYLFVIGFVVSGIYWWIPTYIPKEDQDETTHIIFLSVSMGIVLINGLHTSLRDTL